MKELSILLVDKLTVSYATAEGVLKAVNNVSLSIAPGETLALVGESGSGKSTIALAIMGLLDTHTRVAGTIFFRGHDISCVGSAGAVRGSDLTIVFQDPFTALNPALPIGTQVTEPLIFYRGLNANQARERALATMAEVGLPSPRELLSAYPHQLSGGMQQRVLIATALVCDPSLLILDEPTTALDVTVEARVLDLLERIREHRHLSMLFISHNIGVVNRIADRVAVLYAGQVVETGATAEVLRRPAHPYTAGLLACLPRVGRRRCRLVSIPGRLPDLRLDLPGCVFASRCAFAEARCRDQPQELTIFAFSRAVRCWKRPDLSASRTPLETSTSHPQAAPRPSRALVISKLTKTYRIKTGAIVWRHPFGIPVPMPARRELHAVAGVCFSIQPGEILGLVGESGSGKSTLGRLMLGLLQPTAGEIRFGDRDITRFSGRDLQQFRGAAQIVFQNPDSSLNPRRTIGSAIERALELHRDFSPPSRRKEMMRLLERVGLPNTYAGRYPHQLSKGGEAARRYCACTCDGSVIHRLR